MKDENFKIFAIVYVISGALTRSISQPLSLICTAEHGGGKEEGEVISFGGMYGGFLTPDYIDRHDFCTRK